MPNHTKPSFLFAKIFLGGLLFGIICFSTVVAKEADTLSYSINYKQVAKLLAPITTSSNPAALYVLPKVEYGSMRLAYTQREGTFKPVMSESLSQQVHFLTEKYLFLNDLVLYGEFSGNKKWDSGVNYTNVSNPYRGTPYLMVDTVGNDTYNREYYALKGAFAQAFGKSIIGISVDYRVELAAQNRDPRAKNVSTSLHVKPGYLFQVGTYNVGVNLGYHHYNEDITVQTIQQNSNDNIYYLLGLRSAMTKRDNSFLRAYKRNAYNAELQFSNNWLTLFAGGETFVEKVDNGELGWAVQRNFAQLSGKHIYLNGTVTFSPKLSIHTLKWNGKIRRNIGTEIIQLQETIPPFATTRWVSIAENDTYVNEQFALGIHYSITQMHAAFTRNYVLGFEANYVNQREKYLPLKDEKGMSNMELSAYLYKLFVWKDAMFSVQPKLSYKLNLAHNLEITDYSKNSEITLPTFYTVIENRIVRPDFNYFTANYYSPELQVTFEKDLQKSKGKLFIKGNFKWILPEDKTMGTRQLLSGSIGITL